MPESVLKQNIDFLKKNFHDFYMSLTKPGMTLPGLEVNESDQPGNYTLTMGGIQCNLHSRYSVEREMEMLFKPLSNEENQVIVIFGLGYGHCLDYIKKKRIKYKRIVVFEPCANILYEVLKRRGVVEMLGIRELYLHLMNVPNEMAKFLLQEAMQSKTVKILYHLSYMSLFQDVYDNVLRAFRNERISMETSINTMRAKYIEWNTHQLKSIQNRYFSAAALKDQFKNVPGIIASAGPSLEQHFGLLEEIGDRAVIVAPGSSTRIFNARKLNAHISMSIDSNVIISNFYKNFQLKSILVGAHRLHPDVYGYFPNDVFNVVLSTEYLAQYYFDWAKKPPFLINDHASVSSAAVDMLYYMGCNPIILAGQDLCYHENKNHADDKANSLNEFQARNLIPDVDIYGEKVYTDYGYKTMQNDMELLNIRYRDHVKIYNATEGGLNIHGVENVRFRDVYDKYIGARKRDVTERINAIKAAEERKKYAGGAAAGAGGMTTGAGGVAVDASGAAVDAGGADADASGEMAGGSAAGNMRAGYAGAGNANADYNDKSIPEFFKHLLDNCAETERLINEKDARFVAFAKLIERNVSKNRLNNEIKYIQDYNKRLSEIPFFKQVVFPNIESSLTYYRATGKYISDSGEEWEGAAVFEQKLDAFALDFINVLKAIVLREMVGDLISA